MQNNASAKNKPERQEASNHSPFGTGSASILARCQILVGDICRQATSAIVNSTNHKLIPGGGVDRRIHELAGPELQRACHELQPCETGAALITQGYNLAAPYVIHTVAPIWQGDEHDTSAIALLSRCYQSCLRLARERQLSSIAFPAVGTGVLGFPIDLSARIAIREAKQFIDSDDSCLVIVFVCRTEAVANHYRVELNRIIAQECDQPSPPSPEPAISDHAPNTRQLRNLIKFLLVSDSDFEAFCLDYYHHIKARFTNAMDMEAKITLLLERVESQQVLADLAREYPEETQRFLAQPPRSGSL